MVQTHQHSREESMTMPLSPQASETIWQNDVIVLVRLYYNLCIALEWLFYSIE